MFWWDVREGFERGRARDTDGREFNQWVIDLWCKGNMIFCDCIED